MLAVVVVGAGRGGAGMAARWGSVTGAVLKMEGAAGYVGVIGFAKVRSAFFVVAREGLELWW